MTSDSTTRISDYVKKNSNVVVCPTTPQHTNATTRRLRLRYRARAVTENLGKNKQLRVDTRRGHSIESDIRLTPRASPRPRRRPLNQLRPAGAGADLALNPAVPRGCSRMARRNTRRSPFNQPATWHNLLGTDVSWKSRETSRPPNMSNYWNGKLEIASGSHFTRATGNEGEMNFGCALRT